MSKSKLHTGEHKDPYTYIKPQKANKHTKRGDFYWSIKPHNNKIIRHLVAYFKKALT